MSKAVTTSGTQLVLIDLIELKTAINETIAPLVSEVNSLRAIISGNNQNLSLKDFALKAGLSVPTVRGLINENKISYNQTGERKKITIPLSELNKLKQL